MMNSLASHAVWLPSYVLRRRIFRPCRKYHVFFCLADHFEPRWGKVPVPREMVRTKSWIYSYSKVADKHKDADGNSPKYTLFYPYDEFSPEVFQELVNYTRSGNAEIEMHLHHHDKASLDLINKLEAAVKLYAGYGALSKNKESGRIQYGFIHGNWALDNSLPGGQWCGINNELQVLSGTGCYADFTLPSAPSSTQTRKINSIYYAKDDPFKPKSHDSGQNVRVNGVPWGDLMMIQGPLALNWKKLRRGFFPAVENAEVTQHNPPTRDRIDLWVKQHICVQGKEEWIFIKVHTHGAQDANLTDAYFAALDGMYSYLELRYNDGEKYELHYVSARQMYNLAKAAEAGKVGNPADFKDYILVPNHA